MVVLCALHDGALGISPVTSYSGVKEVEHHCGASSMLAMHASLRTALFLDSLAVGSHPAGSGQPCPTLCSPPPWKPLPAHAPTPLSPMGPLHPTESRPASGNSGSALLVVGHWSSCMHTHATVTTVAAQNIGPLGHVCWFRKGY